MSKKSKQYRWMKWEDEATNELVAKAREREKEVRKLVEGMPIFIKAMMGKNLHGCTPTIYPALKINGESMNNKKKRNWNGK